LSYSKFSRHFYLGFISAVPTSDVILLEAGPKTEVPNYRSGGNGQQVCRRRALH
jgi:hypothetical protein